MFNVISQIWYIEILGRGEETLVFLSILRENGQRIILKDFFEYF